MTTAERIEERALELNGTDQARQPTQRRVIYLTGPRERWPRNGPGLLGEAYGAVTRRLMEDGNTVVVCGPTYWDQFAGQSAEQDPDMEETLLRIMATADRVMQLQLPGWEQCPALTSETERARENGIEVEELPMNKADLPAGAAGQAVKFVIEPPRTEALGPGLTIINTPRYKAVMETDVGSMTFALDTDKAPMAAGSFIYLAEQGFYDDQPLYLIAKDYVIQGGCPNGDGSGDAGYRYPVEKGAALKKGGLAANRTPGGNACQWFIAGADNIKGQYSVFGTLTDGQDVHETLNEWATKGDDTTMPYRPEEPIAVKRIRIEREWKPNSNKATREPTADQKAKGQKRQ